MEFPLNTTGLLRADVWVNETGEHTLEQMKELKEKYPDRTRLEWNERGEIKHFYVLWKEVRRFESTEETRVYKLDRSADKIIFGDGIHKKIPKITDDAAFCIQAYYCNGTDGNVEKGSITDTYANILFIDQVYNPLPAYGGSPDGKQGKCHAERCGTAQFTPKADYTGRLYPGNPAVFGND